MDGAAAEIDAIIAQPGDWRGDTLARLREVVRGAAPSVTESVKWKKPSKPEGVPVWESDGNLCMADTLKNAVRLTFPHGAALPDPSGVFNTRLTSKTVRGVDFAEGDPVPAEALAALVLAAVELNAEKAQARARR